MAEYFIKFRIPTGRLLPPYILEGSEVYEAESAKEAIEKALEEYKKGLRGVGADYDDHPLNIEDVRKI